MIQETTNYDMFQTVTSNREVDPKHVKRLTKSIKAKNLMALNPIIVNSAMEIIDGQHRLEACRALKVPVCYIIGSDINKGDISNLNANSKNWSLIDYINYYTVEKKPGFDKVSKFMAEYPFINASVACSLLKGSIEGGGKQTAAIRDGVIDITNEEEAYRIAKTACKLGNLNPLAFESKFIKALAIISEKEGFDEQRLMSQIDKQPRSLVKCPTTEGYVDLLLELYNYQMHEKNRIKL